MQPDLWYKLTQDTLDYGKTKHHAIDRKGDIDYSTGKAVFKN